MISYLIACGWGILILVSFIGWGTLINRALFPARPVDWGLRAAWGLALCAVMGGILNLAGAISRVTVLAWVTAGAIVWFVSLTKRLPTLPGYLRSGISFPREKILAWGAVLLCALAALEYAGWAFTAFPAASSYLVFPGESAKPVFNVHDDFQAYFVFPEKMLATGEMGPEPFGNRRLDTAYGGQSFLHTLVLAVLPEESLHLLEPGIAWLIVIGLLLGYMGDRGASAGTRIAVLLLFALIPPPYMNISALVTGLVLFISLFRTFASPHLDAGIRRAVVVGLTAAAIASLKHSLIAPDILLLLSGYLVSWPAKRFEQRSLVEPLAAFIFTAAFLAPWVVSMYQTFGTPLYPILGVGPRETEVIRAPVPAFVRKTWPERLALFGDEITSTFLLPLFIFGVALGRFPSNRRVQERLLLAFLVCAYIGEVITAHLLVGVDTYRFCAPFVFGAILVCIADLLIPAVSAEVTSHPYRARLAAAVLGAGVLIGFTWSSAKFDYLGLAQAAGAAMTNGAIVSRTERVQYRRMQSSIPEHQTVLTRLDKPFLLDFSRNPIFIADHPSGMAPAIPRFYEAEPLAKYLLHRSIHYVAYSYRNEAGLPKRVFGPRAATEAYYAYDLTFQHMLEELGQTRRRMYDDGDIFVVDLSQLKQ